MTNYFLSAAAREDLNGIISYLAPKNPAAAITLLDALYEAMEKLAINPHLGHISGHRDITYLLD